MNLITFDGLSLPNGEIKPSYKTIETIRESEDGHDIGTVTRANKLTLNCSIKCDGHLESQIRAKGAKDKGLCTYRGRTFEARLRVSDTPYEKYSEQIVGADGLWTVNFSIIEA